MVISAVLPLSIDTSGGISISGAALTKTDDTNVTLSLGGTPTTALLVATSLTLGWTGTLARARGGTGTGAATTNGQLLIGNTGTGNWSVSTLTAGTNITITNGAGTITINSTGEGTPAALTRVDDTNVTLVLGGTPTTALLQATSLTLGWTGTLAAARLNSSVVQGITNDTNVTGSISAQVLTIGWTGTLAAARLNANVVQAITNDTNVTGSITTQTLTLGWTGQLGLTRGGTAASLTASNGGIVYSTSSALAILAGTATAGLALISGASTTPSWYAPTAGSVLFAGTSGILQQDNANLFWDDTNNRLGVLTAAPTASFSVAEKLLISSTGLVSKYSNVATVEGGIPSCIASINLTGKTAAIAATTLYAVPAAGQGIYAIYWTATITTAATTSSTLGGVDGFQIVYTDPTDSVAKTSPRPDAPSAGLNRSYGQKSQANTTGINISGCIVVFAKASTNIQYSIAYTSSGATAMVFDLNAVCVKL